MGSLFVLSDVNKPCVLTVTLRSVGIEETEDRRTVPPLRGPPLL